MERWRRDAKTGQQLHYFSVPGGGIEAGESPRAAAAREVLEETTIVVRPKWLLVSQKLPNGDHHRYFLCDYLSGQPTLSPDSEEYHRSTPDNVHLPRWVPIDELKAIAFHPDYEPIREMIVKWHISHNQP